MKNLIFFALGFFALLASCSSKSTDDPDDMPTMTTLEMLTSGRWTISLEYFKNTDGTYTKLGSSTCGDDDYWDFTQDGNALELGEGPVLCNPTEPAPAPLTMNWRLENNDERLVLIFPLDEAFYKIVSISDTEMILDHLKQGSYALDGYRTILQR